MENAEPFAYLAAEIDLLRDPLAAAFSEITELTGVAEDIQEPWASQMKTSLRAMRTAADHARAEVQGGVQRPTTA
jgi:hypothetical protein